MFSSFYRSAAFFYLFHHIRSFALTNFFVSGFIVCSVLKDICLDIFFNCPTSFWMIFTSFSIESTDLFSSSSQLLLGLMLLSPGPGLILLIPRLGLTPGLTGLILLWSALLLWRGLSGGIGSCIFSTTSFTIFEMKALPSFLVLISHIGCYINLKSS